jgi:hypothetical protein
LNHFSGDLSSCLLLGELVPAIVVKPEVVMPVVAILPSGADFPYRQVQMINYRTVAEIATQSPVNYHTSSLIGGGNEEKGLFCKSIHFFWCGLS